ncbi:MULTISPECIES: hypothetical protein [unclassified Oceanobacter]|jgi:hypothetical protein|uniref:hypothetical protein n=1 Tax=unclassified Oceanobacter TaxID=2620260 RepID=UPI0026E2F042|nr:MULTISPECIES: hypothetical protein [unclassified Oceanobacter]MDO6681617.1 hypothetical protein [Oceanobacter sp. 5_MG-2023]MDP2505755.1 hypothetical protein [Oceanobacter sp. 3_MG-2023]MDP2547418.1 hypothetical protein [Oceanobacter sp. 4_MG-2023]MDP2608206.1 hypothetical protein [Oceanobacter sp. 1_MG-2023]MDP2612932.1 hypothetical protein [Oceanobacter sp. 2_MG-2023]
MNSVKQQRNADLVWDLQKIHQHKRAVNFVKQFENHFCVFSSSVRQLYTNYNVFFPEEAHRQLVILPDPYAFHDTFNHLNPTAVQSTGLHVIPGNLIGKSGLYLIISHRDKNVRSVPIPFQEGIRQILRRSNSEDPFLPVLMKGDLREFNDQLPCLHLHRLRLNELQSLSSLDRESIRTVITDKLMTLYQESSALNLS